MLFRESIPHAPLVGGGLGSKLLMDLRSWSTFSLLLSSMCVVSLLQKTAKRLRLSKLKLSKYYDSGSLVVFYLVSVVWGIDHIIKVRIM